MNALPAAGQTAAAALAGIAVDETGQPVAGATVRLEELDQAVLTSTSGEFEFSGLPPGAVTVTVDSDSFFAAEVEQIELVAGQTLALELELIRKAIVEETIVVTGTGTEYLAAEAPVRTELITTEMVEKQIKTTLAEALTATIPGIRIEMNCQNCGFTELRMNGLDGAYTQILEDGLPNFSGVAAVYGLEQIPTAFVDQIEVVKGGNAALYGPSAVAGVVNLIRREPRQNRFRVDTQAGWHYGRPEQQLGAAGQLTDIPGGFSGDFFYRGINRTHIDRDRDGYSDLAKRRLHSGGGKLYRSFLEGRARLSFDATYADEFRRGGGQLDRPPHETLLTEQILSRRTAGSLRWNHTPTPTTFYSLKTSLAYLDRDTYYGSHFDPNAYGYTKNPLWVTDMQVGRQIAKHTILAGYQMWRDDVEDVIPAYGRDHGGLFTDHGLYIQDEYRATTRLMILGGVRVDKSNQLDHWVASPRVGLKYGATQNLTLRATLSTGFRAPGVFDEDLHIASAGGEALLIENGPALKEERSVSFSGGTDYNGEIRGRRFQVGASLFYTRLRDNFLLVETDRQQRDSRVWLRENGPGSYVGGVDLNGNFRLASRLNLRGGATFQVARFDEPEPQFGSLDFFRTPERYGFFGFDLDLPKNLEFIGTANFTGSMAVPHFAGFIPEDRLQTSKSFSVLDLVVSKMFNVTDRARLRLYGRLGNVTGAFQPDLDRGPNRDSSYVYGPGAMRQFTIGTTWEF